MAKKDQLDIKNNVTPMVDVPHITKSRKELANQKLKELMNEEGRLVRGMFQCFDNPGASQKVTYKKYPTPAEMRKRGSEGGLEPFSMVMTDGCEYQIPLYVARFLNGVDVTAGAMGDDLTKNINIGSCSYGVHGFRMQGNQMVPSQEGIIATPSGGVATLLPTSGVTKRVKRYGFQSLEFAQGVA